jgi:hypothetical protein
MSQDSDKDDMLPEYDMRGAVRGKFFAHALRWAGITTAEGSIALTVLSTGEPTAKLVIQPSDTQVSLRAPRVPPEEVLTGRA